MLNSFGKYLEFQEYRVNASVLSGAVKPVLDADGGIKFRNALTMEMHNTYQDAHVQALELGVTGVEGTSDRGRIANRFVQQMEQQAKRRFQGKEVSVDLISFKTEGRLGKIAAPHLRKAGGIIVDDAPRGSLLRVMVDGRTLKREQVLELAQEASYYFGQSTKKYGKRGKTFTALKQMQFDAKFGQHKMGIFNPLDLLDLHGDPLAQKVAEKVGWRHGEMLEKVQKDIERAYGAVEGVAASDQMRGRMINALRGLDDKEAIFKAAENVGVQGLRKPKGIDDVLGVLATNDSAQEIFDVLSQAKLYASAKKAVDGHGLISTSVINAMLQQSQKRVQTLENKLGYIGRQSSAELKEAKRFVRELEGSLETGIFNARLSGMRIEKMFGEQTINGIPIDEIVALQAKGNLSVVAEETMARIFGEGLDVIVPSTNISASSDPAMVVGQAVAGEPLHGAAVPRHGQALLKGDLTDQLESVGWRQTVTLEPQKGGKLAKFDILTPSTGSEAISEADIARSIEEMQRSVAEVARAAQGGIIDPDSRAFRIFQQSIEMGLEGENAETIAYYSAILDDLEEGRLASNQVPILIERFRESVFRKKSGGELDPRFILSHTERTYAVSSFWERLRTDGLSAIPEAGSAYTSGGRIVFNDLDIQRNYDAMGGFDLDDAINVTYRKGEGFEAILYRQPNTADEVMRVKIQNIHQSETLKRMLRYESSDFAAKSGILEEIREQVWGNKTFPVMDADMITAKLRTAGSEGVASALTAAVEDGDKSHVNKILNNQIEALMHEAGKKLQPISEPVSRAGVMREVQAGDTGAIRFPGVSRNIGGEDWEFEFRKLTSTKVKRQAGETTTDALNRLVSQSKHSDLLGRWVNSKGTLSMWLDMNKETLAGLRGEEARRVREFLNNAQAMEETVIDALTQGKGLTDEQAQELRRMIKRNWEGQAELTLDIEDLRMEEFMVNNRMPQSKLKERLVLNADTTLGKGLVSLANEGAKKIYEKTGESLKEAKLNVFADIDVSEASQRHAESILNELAEVEEKFKFAPTRKSLQKTILERRFYATVGEELDARAAELFVALSKDGRFAGTVARTFGALGVAAPKLLTDEKPPRIVLDEFFQSIGRYAMPTKGFQDALEQVGFKEGDLAALAEEAWKDTTTEIAELEFGKRGVLYFDRDRNLLPQSTVHISDVDVTELADVLASQSDEAIRDQQYISDVVSKRVAERVKELGEQTAVVPNRVSQAVEAATGELKRGGGMMKEMWSHLTEGTRKGIAVAAVGVVASMLYNAKRDHDYTEEQIGPPQGIPEQYNQGLALSGATAAQLEGTFGTAYDIRTRGGSGFGEDFLRTMATITNGNVYADTYRDPHYDSTLSGMLGGLLT